LLQLCKKPLQGVYKLTKIQYIDPISKRQTTMLNLTSYTSIINQARSFRYEVVLQTIIEGEQKRAAQTKLAWKIGTGLALAAFGIGLDGLDRGDLLFAGVGAAVGGMAHDQANQEMVKYLEQYSSLWIIDGASPSNISRRLGEARSRIFLPEGDSLSLYNHHRGSRGEYLVNLRTADSSCEGFQQPQSLEILSRNFTVEELAEYRTQLWPLLDSSFKVDSLRAVKREEAEAIDPRFIDFIDQGLEPVVIEVNGEAKVGYRTSIPMHSNF
jgi:hypothetical protein